MPSVDWAVVHPKSNGFIYIYIHIVVINGGKLCIYIYTHHLYQYNILYIYIQYSYLTATARFSARYSHFFCHFQVGFMERPPGGVTGGSPWFEASDDVKKPQLRIALCSWNRPGHAMVAIRMSRYVKIKLSQGPIGQETILKSSKSSKVSNVTRPYSVSHDSYQFPPVFVVNTFHTIHALKPPFFPPCAGTAQVKWQKSTGQITSDP